MMAADDNDGVADDIQPVPSHVFDSVNSPVSAKLGGWATGAGSALFAVTKVRIPNKTLRSIPYSSPV